MKRLCLLVAVALFRAGAAQAEPREMVASAHPLATEAGLSVLGACVPVKVREARIGGEAIDAVGDPLPPDTLETCRTSDAVLLGAVGGPRWTGTPRPASWACSSSATAGSI